MKPSNIYFNKNCQLHNSIEDQIWQYLLMKQLKLMYDFINGALFYFKKNVPPVFSDNARSCIRVIDCTILWRMKPGNIYST